MSSVQLADLGVYGFDAVEPVILAALVTEDPLLLIGPTGTGKTFLLNTLSEALGLEHRHYNASLISFDDLVGFPYPGRPDGTGVRFLETPATVWGAESVLIDEISRCKPEHQNRLFSLVHERRVQGIAAAERLRWRWAAMNPCSSDQSSVRGLRRLGAARSRRWPTASRCSSTAADWADLDRGRTPRRGRPRGRRAHRRRWRRAAPGGRRLARDLRAAQLRGAARRWSPPTPPSSPRAQRRGIPHLAAPGAAPRPQPRSPRRIVTGNARRSGCSAPCSPAACRTPAGASSRTRRRSPPPTAPRGTAPRERGGGVGPLVPHRSPARSQAHAAARPRPDPGRGLAGDRAVPAGASRRSAPAPSPLPSTRRRRWAGCRSAPRASTTWPRSPSPILSVEGEVSWSERLNEKNTSHPEIARIGQGAGRPAGRAAERAHAVLLLVHGAQNRCSRPSRPSWNARSRRCVEVLRGAGAGMSTVTGDHWPAHRGDRRPSATGQHRRPDEPHRARRRSLRRCWATTSTPFHLPAHRPPARTRLRRWRPGAGGAHRRSIARGRPRRQPEDLRERLETPRRRRCCVARRRDTL